MDRYGRRRRQGNNLAILLLVTELYRICQSQGVPPITLGSIGIQVAIFLKIIPVPWRSLSEVCLSVHHAVDKGKWLRIVAAQLEHGDEWHLYYNMLSFVWKGRTLEKRFGARRFSLILIIFTLATGLVYLGLNMVLSGMDEFEHYRQSCAVGFSGVIFALKVLTTHYWPSDGPVYVGGLFRVASKYAVWAELVVIQLLTPNASFVGHLAGILVGMAYIYGPLSVLIDILESLISSDGPTRRFTQSSYQTGGSSSSSSSSSRRPGWRFPQPTAGYSSYSPSGMSEEEQFERAREESLRGESRRSPPYPTAPPYPTDNEPPRQAPFPPMPDPDLLRRLRTARFS